MLPELLVVVPLLLVVALLLLVVVPVRLLEELPAVTEAVLEVPADLRTVEADVLEELVLTVLPERVVAEERELLPVLPLTLEPELAVREVLPDLVKPGEVLRLLVLLFPVTEPDLVPTELPRLTVPPLLRSV